jgi:NAD(P)-dependent dehydrogenase (short-subunit alcohol dehydrogenase family)/ribulose-5-phosphate 4-epimerase/fuculose-1-phosphate aldolase
VEEVYGARVIVVPYIMPGFVLAKKVAELIRGRDLRAEGVQGLVLLKHGLFTFDDDAQRSYELHIEMVSLAEAFLAKHQKPRLASAQQAELDFLAFAQLRQRVSALRGGAQIAKLDASAPALEYVNDPDILQHGVRGPLTPDHSIRTKPVPAVIQGGDVERSIQAYAEAYKVYFSRYATAGQQMLDAAPRFVLWPQNGIVSFGDGVREAGIVADIAAHTAVTVRLAESVGQWQPLDERDLFEIEYWELEQAKLRAGGARRVHQGKVALVTGCAAGIGFAIAESLAAQGAQVVGLDINPEIPQIMQRIGALGLVVDVTDEVALKAAVERAVRDFGGLDVVVGNAGIFPKNEYLDQMAQTDWERTLAINLTSHQKLLRYVIPYLKLGIEPSLIFVGSRNFKAPGPGASAYSCSKAALTQLCRVAALELAPFRVRVNMVHPDAVFDTQLWTPEALQRSAERYGMTVEEYKTKNLMKVEIKSKDVGLMVAALASPLFSKVTGAQIPLDGGNDRVI